MKQVVVASQNPVKIQATRKGFRRMFPREELKIKGVKIPSGVKEQPLSDAETIKGALNRARRAQHRHPKADFWVGIEGGVGQQGREMYTFAWVVIFSNEVIGKGRTAAFPLPPKAVELIRKGKELGDVMDTLFSRSNSKQQEGAIGILTDGIIDRTSLYTPAVISALIPFKKRTLYDK